MPERWQRELKRLRRVEPSGDLWARVEEGPHGTPAPVPGRQRLLAGGVAFAVFIAAGVFAWNVLRPAGTVVGDASVLSPGPGDLVVTLRAPTEPSTATELHLPTAVFRLGEQATEIPTQGMTGWPDIPADTFTAPLYSLDFNVPAATRLVIQGDATSASSTVRNGIPIDSPTQGLDLSGGSAILPSDPGQYVIDMTGSWDEGTATFTARFDVVPIEEVAVLTFDEQDPAAPLLSFTVGGATFPAILGSHSWTFDNGSGYADTATPTFTDADLVQVVSGTPLLLQDPPPTVSIMANEGLTLNHGPPVGTPLKLDLGASRAFDLPQGKYLVIVDAQWNDAQAQFWLAIEIVNRQIAPSFTPSPAGTPGWTQYEDANNAITVQVPDDWTFVSDPTPNVTDPRTLFASASFPIVAADPCNWFSAVPSGGALVWVEEWFDVSGLGGTPAEFPQKPSEITLASGERYVYADCLSHSGQQVYLIPFQQNGRYFWGQAAFGSTASAETRATAELILTNFSGLTPTATP